MALHIRRLLVTGGAGFIGSAFVRQRLKSDQEIAITVLDKLTYAGSEENLAELRDDRRLRFVKGDICDPSTVDELAKDVDAIVNFAAESHVDRSLLDAGAFVQTDVYGTYVLLEAARRFCINGSCRSALTRCTAMSGMAGAARTIHLFPAAPTPPPRLGPRCSCT